MEHDLRDAEGFYHRIDAVPNVGREVRIQTTDRRTIDAVVIAASDADFHGIGCEVAYRAHDGSEIVAAEGMRRWRYF